ncbi:MAG: hypothetical protein QOE82_2184 [Thermoanaerobaculia bacterium]|jgi:CHAT domain-containing protein|nr:hypothetical protein [Thermoanaerobaculia bacterium]
MNDVEPRHPKATTMAAFVDGVLAPDEIAEVAAHLRDCGDCRTVVAETARFEREEEVRPVPAHGRRMWRLAAAAVFAAIAVLVPLLRWNANRHASPIANLIAVAPHHRFIEARLSGFPWAQLQAPSRGTALPDPSDLKLTGAAGDVLEKTANDRKTEARHAAGVAYLLIDRKSDGIAALEQAANGSNDAHVWSDLAAARYAVATQDERPSQFPLALADADHALRLDPKSPEALFNRALILERLGIRDQARKAWQAYLDVDTGSAWSVEARAHLRALQSTSRFNPKALYTEPPAQLVRAFPQEARTWGEGPMLAEWADAEAANDHARASMILSRVHAIADALAAFNGERLLGDAVSAIERSTPPARAALIDAHRLYRDARVAYSKRNAGTAEEMFVRAVELFRQTASPMGNMASYYAAIAAADQNHGDESQHALDHVLALADSQRDRALGAQILGSEAVQANAAGAWGISVQAADRGSATFRVLGEARNAAYLDYVAAHAYDMIGAGDVAWARRIRSCAALSDQDHERLCTNLRSSATTLESFGRIEAATSMIDLAIDEIRNDPAQLISALTDRARLATRSGDAERAKYTLARANNTAFNVTDRKLRETLQASLDVAYAGLPGTAPRDAIFLLDRAIAFFRKTHNDDLLPNAYLQRARAFRASGDAVAAVADYDAALREVDAQRNTIAGDDLKLRFLDTAAQIIEESIDLQLSRGAVNEAFSIADRTRDLHGSVLTSSPALLTSGQMPQTALIEYVVLPHKIEVFCIVGGLLTVETVPADREGVAQRIAALGEHMRRRATVEEINADAAILFKLLIAPIESRLATADEIVIVPDRALYPLPFASLYDEAKNQYLVERFTIRLAPSAVITPARTASASLRPALVIADPSTTQSPRLPASLNEGQRIAAGYGTTALSGAEATAAKFVELAPQSALIHYSGHADSSHGAPGASYGALLFAGSGNEQSVLSSSQIERLPLRNHPLVVLAACGTLRGDSVHVGGPSSVARAFLTAGASGVAGTLWEVEDDLAAAMFLRFHELLRAGESPARAVRTAQLEMIHSSNDRLRNPATWAPVELYGPL